nr:immunoglobulin heavy chain junction region [Macaca mulatta]MOV41137.1 immunoglobulin heavy chain junction region [Macaca mulatta]MOV41413.1 immunoglobulin heavy chain junction region [Macaca mulatta]MOV45601.1 immunoglobulin heavy chain junction region [Macaca mulatta]MOV53288.1 immunoglobulin heavy chain junction region [Macaca mulatta]
CTTMKIW